MKGQFEAMGLAVIVILISLGLLLLVMFSLNKTSDAPQRYESEQLSQNIVDAMLKTDSGECSLNYAGLIEDVAVRGRNPCTKPSKTLLTQMTKSILDYTLTQRGIDYRYVIEEQGGSEILSLGTCDPQTTETNAPGQQIMPMPYSTKKVVITLWLC